MNKLAIRITSLAFAVSLLACGDEQTYFPKIESAEGGAHIKFLHAASDTVAVAFYINDAKVSSGAAVNSSIGYFGTFPSTDYSTFADASAFKVIVPTNQKVMTSATLNVTSGSYYTVAFAGVSLAYEAVLIEDAMTSVPFDGQAYIRFINLIHNSTNKVDVVATPLSGDLTPIVLATDVAFKGSAAFTAQLPRNYTIRLIDSVTDGVIATASAANGTLVGNKVYTMVARGRIGAGGTGAPTLDRVINR